VEEEEVVTAQNGGAWCVPAGFPSSENREKQVAGQKGGDQGRKESLKLGVLKYRDRHGINKEERVRKGRSLEVRPAEIAPKKRRPPGSETIAQRKKSVSAPTIDQRVGERVNNPLAKARFFKGLPRGGEGGDGTGGGQNGRAVSAMFWPKGGTVLELNPYYVALMDKGCRVSYFSAEALRKRRRRGGSKTRATQRDPRPENCKKRCPMNIAADRREDGKVTPAAALGS